MWATGYCHATEVGRCGLLDIVMLQK